MAFFKKYSYIIIKLFLNQFAISLFGIGLAFACGYANNNKLLLITSIFSVVFYLFLQYAIMWEVGAKDGITATSRHTSRGLWRGLVLGVCANAINIVAAILVVTKVFASIGNAAAGIGYIIAMGLQGMYLGILVQPVGGIRILDYGWVLFLTVLPAVLVSALAYIIGNYGWHFTNILIPKNKDVKNNGRPK